MQTIRNFKGSNKVLNIKCRLLETLQEVTSVTTSYDIHCLDLKCTQLCISCMPFKTLISVRKNKCQLNSNGKILKTFIFVMKNKDFCTVIKIHQHFSSILHKKHTTANVFKFPCLSLDLQLLNVF